VRAISCWRAIRESGKCRARGAVRHVACSSATRSTHGPTWRAKSDRGRDGRCPRETQKFRTVFSDEPVALNRHRPLQSHRSLASSCEDRAFRRDT
jgi:hypothetical protein